jgi:hypothetical protein
LCKLEAEMPMDEASSELNFVKKKKRSIFKGEYRRVVIARAWQGGFGCAVL